jgi:hypothetical protein
MLAQRAVSEDPRWTRAVRRPSPHPAWAMVDGEGEYALEAGGEMRHGPIVLTEPAALT